MTVREWTEENEAAIDELRVRFAEMIEQQTPDVAVSALFLSLAAAIAAIPDETAQYEMALAVREEIMDVVEEIGRDMPRPGRMDS